MLEDEVQGKISLIKSCNKETAYKLLNALYETQPDLEKDLVSEIGTELSKKLEYKYPDKLENDIRKYLAGLKPKT